MRRVYIVALSPVVLSGPLATSVNGTVRGSGHKY